MFSKTIFKIRIYAVFFGITLLIDLIKFLSTKKVWLINWESYVHAGWPVLSFLMMVAVAVFYERIYQIILFPLALHFLAVFASYINKLFNFNWIFNEYCLYFNLILFTLYFIAADDLF